MDLLNSIFLPVYQMIMLFVIIAIIGNIRYRTKDLVILLFILIGCMIFYFIIGQFSIIILSLSVIVYGYYKKRLVGIIIAILSYLLSFIMNFFTILTMGIFREYSPFNLIDNLIYSVIHTIFILILAYLFNKLLNILNKSILSLSKLYLILISLSLLAAFVVLYMYVPKNFIPFPDFKFLAGIYIIFTLIFVFLLITISYSIIREVQYKRNMKEVQNYYEYTLKIEKINNEMRKFRHDYVNILSTMSEFIREDDMEGLRKYFNEEIVPMQDNMQAKSIKINGLENFYVREIKGLLTTKILQAQEKNIRISIEVPDIIEKINLQTIDLSRMIGIILDNAIEASEQLKDEPLIRVGFIQESESVTFIVMNKCQPDMPRVHTLFEENFSTKGDNRGLGLSTLKEIAEDNENVLLDTTIENGFFIQKVEILDFEP